MLWLVVQKSQEQQIQLKQKIACFFFSPLGSLEIILNFNNAFGAMDLGN